MINNIFEQIKKTNEYGSEYWSARDLFKLLGYTEYGKFIPTIYSQYQTQIDQLLHPKVLFGMMLVVTIATAWTGVVYIFENWKTLRELYEPKNVL